MAEEIPVHSSNFNRAMATWERIRRNGEMSDFKMQLYNKNDFDHAETGEIKKMISECNVIKYAAYRTGAKLLVLHKYLYMQHVNLKFVVGVFCRHLLHSVENNRYLSSSELESVLADIYFGARRETLSDFSTDTATQLTLSILRKIYDKKCTNAVQVISAKVLLVVLSVARLQEKYQYLFHELADHNNCISKKKLEVLLQNVTCLMEFLGESHCFGSNFIPSAVESCFQESEGGIGLTEDRFTAWVLSEPEILTWLSTMYRMNAADKVTHFVKCRVCKNYPVTGLLYQCLQCLNYSQCQSCFLLGKINKKHKLKHPMQEYCSEVSMRQSTRMFWKVLLNRLWKTSFRLQYLHVEPHDSVLSENGEEIEDPVLSEDNQESDELELSVQTVVEGSRVTLPFQPQQELGSIIAHLEQQNRKLQLDIEELFKAKKDTDMEKRIRNHRTRVESQIKRLKVLQSYLQRLKPLNTQKQLQCFESTPVVTTLAHRLREAYGVNNISPILRTEEESRFSLEVKDLKDYAETKNNTDANAVSHETVRYDTQQVISDVTGSDLSMWYKDATNYSLYSESSSGLSRFFPKSNNNGNSNKTLDELQGDLDAILDKLDKMLTSSLLSDDVTAVDNRELQETAFQVQSMLSGLIDHVEENKQVSG